MPIPTRPSTSSAASSASTPRTRPAASGAACTFLGAILDAEDIPYSLYDAGDDRVSLRAVIPGDGSARPFMLLNHTDVVPVQREFWDEDPFSGLIKDGFIWGRGALDMKGLGIAQLMTFLTVKRLGLPLRRDLVFYAMADEEAGSEFGIRWLERNHPETLDAEFVINEGGGGVTEVFGVERPVYNVAVSEKGPLWLRLVAEGRPGHGSVPHDDNALDRLVRAMFRVQEWQRDLSVSPLLSEYFSRLAHAGIFKGEATVEGLTKAADRRPARPRPAQQHHQRDDHRRGHQAQRHPRARRGHPRLPPAARRKARRLPGRARARHR